LGDDFLKKGDLIWAAGMAAAVLFMLHPAFNGVYVSVNLAHPFLMGFAKFFVLATMGELLTLRIVRGAWTKPSGLLYRAGVWGIIGMATTLMFDVFAGGVSLALEKGLLPGGDSRLAFAFFTSAIANLAFAPTFMSVHKVTDALIDLRIGHKQKAGIAEAVKSVDWEYFATFVLLKTLPIIWIPAHTITFMLPAEYRVLSAALLSVLLGALLAIPKGRAANRQAQKA
jgi:hypothetical protein